MIRVSNGSVFQTIDEWENIWTWLARFIENNYKEDKQGMLVTEYGIPGSVTIHRLYKMNKSHI